VAVRGVDDEHVDPGSISASARSKRIGADADRGADAQAALLVLRRERVLDALLDVLDGDQALEMPSASTTGSFSILWRWRISSASSSVVPTGAVTSRAASSAPRPAGRGSLEAQVAVREDADERPRRR
jgi:hypothetical protein